MGGQIPSPPQDLYSDYSFSQIQALSLKLWSREVLTVFPNLSLYVTYVFFLFLHIFAYLDSKCGSIIVLYGSQVVHILLMSPKWTSDQGVMPSWK
jgi:hypothetical protein